MKPNDAPPLIVPRSRAIHALVVTLAAQVKIEHRSFVRGDMAVREADAEKLLHLAPGTLRKRRELFICRYHPTREGNRYWYSLFELADTMLNGNI